MKSTLEELPIEIAAGDLVTRYAEWGDMAVRHASIPPGTDMGPVLAGLPGDRCPSDHWGIVLSGSVTLIHKDGTEELTSAGEVYYWPAGHSAVSSEGAVFLEIGPVAEMRQFSEHAKHVFASA